MVKNLLVSAGVIGDMGVILGLERSSGGGNGTPLQYSCLEIPWLEESGESGGLQSVESQKSQTEHTDIHNHDCYVVENLNSI